VCTLLSVLFFSLSFLLLLSRFSYWTRADIDFSQELYFFALVHPWYTLCTCLLEQIQTCSVVRLWFLHSIPRFCELMFPNGESPLKLVCAVNLDRQGCFGLCRLCCFPSVFPESTCWAAEEFLSPSYNLISSLRWLSRSTRLDIDSVQFEASFAVFYLFVIFNWTFFAVQMCPVPPASWPTHCLIAGELVSHSAWI
jgi:hypothetical protein